MINRIFMTFCLAAMTSAPLHGDELSIKISLGIRDSKLVTTTNVAYPLAFRIENIGKAVVKEDQIPGLFLKGVIHILPKDGKEQHTEFQKMWRTRVYDLQPGATFRISSGWRHFHFFSFDQRWRLLGLVDTWVFQIQRLEFHCDQRKSAEE